MFSQLRAQIDAFEQLNGGAPDLEVRRMFNMALKEEEIFRGGADPTNPQPVSLDQVLFGLNKSSALTYRIMRVNKRVPEYSYVLMQIMFIIVTFWNYPNLEESFRVHGTEHLISTLDQLNYFSVEEPVLSTPTGQKLEMRLHSILQELTEHNTQLRGGEARRAKWKTFLGGAGKRKLPDIYAAAAAAKAAAKAADAKRLKDEEVERLKKEEAERKRLEDVAAEQKRQDADAAAAADRILELEVQIAQAARKIREVHNISDDFAEQHEFDLKNAQIRQADAGAIANIEQINKDAQTHTTLIPKPHSKETPRLLMSRRRTPATPSSPIPHHPIETPSSPIPRHPIETPSSQRSNYRDRGQLGRRTPATLNSSTSNLEDGSNSSPSDQSIFEQEDPISSPESNMRSVWANHRSSEGNDDVPVTCCKSCLKMFTGVGTPHEDQTTCPGANILMSFVVATIMCGTSYLIEMALERYGIHLNKLTLAELFGQNPMTLETNPPTAEAVAKQRTHDNFIHYQDLFRATWEAMFKTLDDMTDVVLDNETYPLQKIYALQRHGASLLTKPMLYTIIGTTIGTTVSVRTIGVRRSLLVTISLALLSVVMWGHSILLDNITSESGHRFSKDAIDFVKEFIHNHINVTCSDTPDSLCPKLAYTLQQTNQYNGRSDEDLQVPSEFNLIEARQKAIERENALNSLAKDIRTFLETSIHTQGIASTTAHGVGVDPVILNASVIPDSADQSILEYLRSRTRGAYSMQHAEANEIVQNHLFEGVMERINSTNDPFVLIKYLTFLCGVWGLLYLILNYKQNTRKKQ